MKPESASPQTKGAPAVLLVAAAGLCWSFAGLLSRFTPWSALSLVGYRAIFPVITLGLARKSFRPSHSPGNWLGGAGVVVTAILFIYAIKLTSAANAIVLQYAMPAVVILIQAAVFRVLPTRKDVLATLLVIAGVILCFYQGMGNGTLLGDSLSLLSAGTWALVFLAARMPNTDAMSYTYMGNLLGCGFLPAMLFDPGIAAGGVTGWLAASAMGLCLGAGYLCFGKGLNAGISPTLAAITANVEPILNPTWVFLFLGENPGALAILGAAIVLATVTWHAITEERTSTK